MKCTPTLSENLARYVFAINYCRKRNVIDVGCARGHGSFLLGYSANTVTGIDLSTKSIFKAPNLFKFVCPTTFQLCNLEKEFPEGEWDVAVCFEVI